MFLYIFIQASWLSNHPAAVQLCWIKVVLDVVSSCSLCHSLLSSVFSNTIIARQQSQGNHLFTPFGMLYGSVCVVIRGTKDLFSIQTWSVRLVCWPHKSASGQQFFFIISCSTEGRLDATGTHYRLSRHKVVLWDGKDCSYLSSMLTSVDINLTRYTSCLRNYSLLLNSPLHCEFTIS